LVDKGFVDDNLLMLVTTIKYSTTWDSTNGAKTLSMQVTINNDNLKSCQHRRHLVQQRAN
jgi:hypothetical protein